MYLNKKIIYTQVYYIMNIQYLSQQYLQYFYWTNNLIVLKKQFQKLLKSKILLQNIHTHIGNIK